MWIGSVRGRRIAVSSVLLTGTVVAVLWGWRRGQQTQQGQPPAVREPAAGPPEIKAGPPSPEVHRQTGKVPANAPVEGLRWLPTVGGFSTLKDGRQLSAREALMSPTNEQTIEGVVETLGDPATHALAAVLSGGDVPLFPSSPNYYCFRIGRNPKVLRLIGEGRRSPAKVAGLLRHTMGDMLVALPAAREGVKGGFITYGPDASEAEKQAALRHNLLWAQLNVIRFYFPAALYVLANIDQVDAGSLVVYLRSEHLSDARSEHFVLLLVNWFFAQPSQAGTEAAQRHLALAGNAFAGAVRYNPSAWPTSPAVNNPMSGNPGNAPLGSAGAGLLKIPGRALQISPEVRKQIVKNFLDYADMQAAKLTGKAP